MVDISKLSKVGLTGGSASPTLNAIASSSAPTAEDEAWWQEVLNPDKSAFGAGLSWLDKPGQIVRNLLAGKGGSALRQAGDFLLQIPDAILPGDVIPDFAREQDYTSGSDLLKQYGAMDKNAHWGADLAADLGVGLLTDPLSYLTFGGTSAAGRLAALGKQGRALGQAQRGAVAATRELPAAMRAAVAPVGAVSDDLVQQLPQLLSRDLVEQTLRRSLSKQGKKALRDAPETVQSRIKGIADELTDEAGFVNEVDLIDKAKGLLKGDNLFEQGGARFLGKQIMEEGAIFNRLPADVQNLIGGAKEAVQRRLRPVTAALGWSDTGEIGSDILDESRALASRTGQAWMAKVPDIVQDLSPLEREALTSVFQGVDATALKKPTLGNRGAMQSADELIAKGDRRMFYQGDDWNTLPLEQKADWALSSESYAGVNKDAVKQAAERISKELSRGELDEMVGKGWVRPQTAFEFADNPGVKLEASDVMAEWKNSVRALERELRQSTGKAEKAEIRRRIAAARQREAEVGRGADMRRAAALKNPIRQTEAQRSLEQTAARGDTLLSREGAVSVEADAWRQDADRLASQLKGDKDFEQWLQSRGLQRVDADPGVENYLQRQMSGQKTVDATDADELTGAPSALMGRTLESPQELYEFLRTNANIQMEPDAFKTALNRAEQQGRIAQRANIVKRIFGKDVALNDPGVGKAMDNFLKVAEATDDSFAKIMRSAWAGTAPRNDFLKLLSATNRMFKPAAVYGVIIPKGLSTLARNQLSGIMQAAAQEGAVLAGKQAKVSLGNLWGATAEMMNNWFGTSIKTKTFRDDVLDIHKALQGVPGGADDAVAALRNAGMKDAADALQYGALDGFVAGEQILRELGATKAGGWLRGLLGSKKSKRAFDILDAPGKGFQSMEQYMRYAHFKELRKRGVSPKDAAKSTQDTFFDYTVMSPENRTLRDIIPFAAFSTNAIRQQGKWIARRPAVGVAAGQLYANDEGDPKLPWIADQPSVRVGDDAEGNPLYATSLGLPFEALDMIPGSADPLKFGKKFRQDIIGSSHPLLKFAFGAVSGKDPFFGTTFGSYDKAPQALQWLGADANGDAGRRYNTLASTGMIQPAATLLQTVDRFTDPRLDWVQRGLSLTSGARLASNDPDRATYELAKSALELSPTARAYTTYKGGTEADDAVIRAREEAGRRLRDKREAAATVE